MKILTWNIRHGGAVKALPGIRLTLIDHDADVVVLTEYRTNKDQAVRAALHDAGLIHQASSDPPPKTNGILVGSKISIEVVPVPDSNPCPHRWLEFRLVESGLRVLGVHIPTSGDKWGKKPFWDAVLAYARQRADDRCLLIGDFNTGLKIDAEGVPFHLSSCMAELQDLGWCDAFRTIYGDALEFTWWSGAGNGFRLDYAFLSPALRLALLGARHSQEERLRRYSDHASLVVEIDSSALSTIDRQEPAI